MCYLDPNADGGRDTTNPTGPSRGLSKTLFDGCGPRAGLPGEIHKNECGRDPSKNVFIDLAQAPGAIQQKIVEGGREILPKIFVGWISPGTRRICRISTHALVWVEMRQALRPSPEIHKKNLLMDVAPAPAGGDRSIDFFVAHITPRARVICRISNLINAEVQIREILRGPGDIHWKK